jgi:hypothetical protein
MAVFGHRESLRRPFSFGVHYGMLGVPIPSTDSAPAAYPKTTHRNHWRPDMSIRSCLIVIVPALLVLMSSGAVADEQQANSTIEIPCLEGEVEVILDRDGVPHIFAENDLDAWKRLGSDHSNTLKNQ